LFACPVGPILTVSTTAATTEPVCHWSAWCATGVPGAPLQVHAHVTSRLPAGRITTSTPDSRARSSGSRTATGRTSADCSSLFGSTPASPRSGYRVSPAHGEKSPRWSAVTGAGRMVSMTVREPFALTHATLVTGDADGTVLPDRTVVVGSTGHIERVEASSEVSVPPECRTIDSSGRYVVPGLINAHAHLFADGRPLPSVLLNRNAAELVSTFTRSPVGHRFVKQRAKSNVITQLLSGVTTLRSLGDVGYEVVAVGREIARGEYLGPRVIASGPLHAISGGHGAPQIALVSDSPRQARHNVRHAIRHGVSATKIAATGGVTDSRAI